MVQPQVPTAADIGRWFAHAAAKELAYCIAMHTPAGPDQSVAPERKDG